MTYTINDGTTTTSLEDVQVEEMQMNTDIQLIPIPLQTSDKTLGVGFTGSLRVILLQGIYSGTSPTPQAWVKTIADLVNDNQVKADGTQGYTYHSDKYSDTGKNFNVKIQRFKYRIMAGEGSSFVTYELNMVEVKP